MKKPSLIILSIITLFCLTACGKDTKPQAVINNTAGECKQSVFANAMGNMAVGETGYYTLEGLGKYNYITYISKDSAKSTYLCGKPECSHVDDSGWHGLETCNAYIGRAMPLSITYYNGYVYVLRYDEKTYNVTLVRISADGSVHEDVMVVGQSPDCASYYQYVFADDNTVFMVYNSPDYTSETHTMSLDKLDLNKKEKISVCTYTGEGADINNLKILNNNLFYRRTISTDGQKSYELVQYDIQTGAVNPIEQGNIISYTIADNGMIFLYMAEDAMYSLDLATMKSVKIRDCDDDTMYVMLAYDGKYLYLDNILNRGYHDKNSEHRIFVCDTEGNTINTVKAGIDCLSVSDPDYMFAQDASGGMMYWQYIKKENIKDAAEWSRIE